MTLPVLGTALNCPASRCRVVGRSQATEKRTCTGVVAPAELPTKASFQTSHVSSHHGYLICLCSRIPADMTTERSQGKKIIQLRSVIPQNCEILIARLLFQLWNKIFILWQGKKNQNKNFLCPLAFPLPTLCMCILPQQQKYLLNHKEQHSP